MKLTLAMAVAIFATAANAQQTRYIDSRGNNLGTSSPVTPNSVRNWDSRGNTLGTSTTDSQGTTTHYDANGRVIGQTRR